MKLLFLLLLFANIATQADVVKPALVEISIFENKTLEVRIDLSLEAAMTGIGTQYKNTTDSPDSARYDELRALEPNNLRQKFKKFETEFLNSLQLKINSEQQSLSLTQVDIDIVGYKKRPRKTTLTYTAKLTEWPKALSWQYGKIHGDSALRWQIYQANEYNWSQWQWLRGGDPSGVIHIDHPEFQSDTQRFFQFIKIGFDHVVPLGWDHILFIIGMALSSLLWRRLLILVSAFTLAHTLTLGLAMIEVLEVSARLVEPLIAFSIAYVAIENLLIKQSIKRKTVIVFLFGLVHGLGFAGMLQEFELSPESFLSTLIGFNVGVELAQVMIVTVVVMLLLSLRALGWNYRQLVVIPVSVLIALIGFWWGLERLFG
ncbi:MAG: HupE/UreJ family protein [Gammaproteobacteria bacterium]